MNNRPKLLMVCILIPLIGMLVVACERKPPKNFRLIVAEGFQPELGSLIVGSSHPNSDSLSGNLQGEFGKLAVLDDGQLVGEFHRGAVVVNSIRSESKQVVLKGESNRELEYLLVELGEKEWRIVAKGRTVIGPFDVSLKLQ